MELLRKIGKWALILVGVIAVLSLVAALFDNKIDWAVMVIIGASYFVVTRIEALDRRIAALHEAINALATRHLDHDD